MLPFYVLEKEDKPWQRNYDGLMKIVPPVTVR